MEKKSNPSTLSFPHWTAQGLLGEEPSTWRYSPRTPPGTPLQRCDIDMKPRNRNGEAWGDHGGSVSGTFWHVYIMNVHNIQLYLSWCSPRVFHPHELVEFFTDDCSMPKLHGFYVKRHPTNGAVYPQFLLEHPYLYLVILPTSGTN